MAFRPYAELSDLVDGFTEITNRGPNVVVEVLSDNGPAGWEL